MRQMKEKKQETILKRERKGKAGNKVFIYWEGKKHLTEGRSMGKKNQDVMYRYKFATMNATTMYDKYTLIKIKLKIPPPLSI